MTKDNTLAVLPAPQGVHQRYAQHEQPLIVHAKPTLKSWTFLDIAFTKGDDSENPADEARSPLFESKGTVKSLYEGQLSVQSGEDVTILGSLKRRAWSWRNRFTFTGSTLATPSSSPILVEAVSGRFKGWQTLRVVYTDTLSGQRDDDGQEAEGDDGEGHAEVLARVGRKRSAILKCHWARTSELRDEETGALLMTIVQKKTNIKGWSLAGRYTLTIAPHFDAVIAAACFLMHHYIILRYKVRKY